MRRIPARRLGSEMSRHDIAADWIIREDEGQLSVTQQMDRDAWLKADAANRTAYEDVRAALSITAQIASDPEIMTARAHALAAAPPQDRGIWKIAAAFFAVIFVGAAWWIVIENADLPPVGMAASNPNTMLYRTKVGERTTVTLPDGSTATLDTDSTLRLAYSGEERGVQLLRGQALFDVAKYQPLPFHVYAGGHRVAAIGTQFDVRLDGQGRSAKVQVALVEGVVKVAKLRHRQDGAAPQASVTMAAGELLKASATEPMRVSVADIQAMTSWSAGLLIFDDMPLDRAVAEVNRYTRSPVVLADPKLSQLRVSGVFKIGLPKHFAETVADTFALNVAYGADGSPELKRP
jgi:transmembrane sensor